MTRRRPDDIAWEFSDAAFDAYSRRRLQVAAILAHDAIVAAFGKRGLR